VPRRVGPPWASAVLAVNNAAAIHVVMRIVFMMSLLFVMLGEALRREALQQNRPRPHEPKPWRKITILSDLDACMKTRPNSHRDSDRPNGFCFLEFRNPICLSEPR
jgi:hypothetical protein